MYEMERAVNQELWWWILPEDVANADDHFENDVFEVVPFDWNSDEEQEYNFYHKPSGIKVRWYKYPLRSPKCNDMITPLQFRNVLYDCLNSTMRNTRFDIDRWWERK